MKIILYSLTLLFCLGITQSLFAQKEGYVVNSKGDTTKGKMKMKLYKQEEEISLWIEGKKKPRVYKGRVLTAYGIKKGKTWKHYERKKVGRERLQLERLVNGKVKVFMFFEENSFGKEEPIYLLEKGDEIQRIRSTTYEKELKRYFEDCEKLVERVGKGGYKFKNTPDMVEEYNRCWKSEEETEEK